MPIRTENLSFTYKIGTPLASAALRGVNLIIDDGEFVGLAGRTGSGKSTLVQHLNGLLRPTEGKVWVDDLDLTDRSVNMKQVRRKVGLVFQYPEHQLFEETVYADVSFGPRNLGLPADEVLERVKDAMATVGLDFEELKDRSPFELSGGQMRRAAIAGVLAMNPKFLILDEPTAGLDPRGRDEILGQMKKLHARGGLTIILVSHSMEDIARLVDRLIVMDQGQVAIDGDVRAVFSQADLLRSLGLGVPQVTELMREVRRRGPNVRTDILTVREARDEILATLGRKANAH